MAEKLEPGDDMGITDLFFAFGFEEMFNYKACLVINDKRRVVTLAKTGTVLPVSLNEPRAVLYLCTGADLSPGWNKRQNDQDPVTSSSLERGKGSYDPIQLV